MKIVSSLIIVLFSSFVVSAQTKDNTIEITYVKAYKNSKDTTKTSPKFYKNIEYTLLCNKIESRFEYIKTLDNEFNRQNKRLIRTGGGAGVHYKNLKEQIKIWQIDSFDEETYLVLENFNQPVWNLEKETKKILGYDCFKAIGSYVEYSPRKGKEITLYVEAWYAPSLSLPFGPAGYDGLPGTVLESYRASFYLMALNIKIYNKREKIKVPSKGIKLTKEAFFRKIHSYMSKVLPRKKN